MTYFSLPELTRSDTAARLAIDNTPTPEVISSLTLLVEKVLDPLREAWGRPLIVTSGYRCPRLNRAVGGVATSHHMRGMAADITTGNITDNRRLFQLAIDLRLPFTQLIDERGFSWIHLSHDPSDIRRQVLRL